MTEPPRISVCIPTYNRAAYLPAAIDSVLRQTCQDFEIIVYDDASTDNTREVISFIRDNRLHYFCQPKNVGIARNRNSCLEVARGEYIAWLDSDDLYLPHMLECQSRVLDENPAVGLVHGRYELIDADGERLPDWPVPFTEDTIESSRDALAELVVCNYLSTPTVVMRRQCFEQAGMYAAEMGNFAEDWEMWLRIATHVQLAYTAAPVAQVRIHAEGISAATTHAGQWAQSERQTLRRFFAQLPPKFAEIHALRTRARSAIAAKALLRSGDARLRGRRRIALAEAFQAVKSAPWLLHNRHGWLLFPAILADNEYRHHSHSQALMTQLYAELADTRYGKTIQKRVVPNDDWERLLHEVAETVRRLVPQTAAVALVDKWDPMLLTLCQRKGWHFPDLGLHPAGYPADSDGAITHLKALIDLGAAYLVFPNASFWWLEHYAGFREYLEDCHQQRWGDDNCLIYELSRSVPTHSTEGIS